MSEENDFISSSRAESAEMAYERAQREVEKLEEYYSIVGETPPSKTKGFLSSLLDTLDTPGQWVRGNVADLAGIPEYDNLSFLDAAKKGAEENLTVGDILRKKGILKEHPIIRGVAGFIGDVALDPLSWLTFGGGLGPRIGGKAVSNKLLKTKEGAQKTIQEIIKDKGLQLYDESLIDLNKLKSSGLKSADELDELLGELQTTAFIDAARPVEAAKNILAQKKKFTRAAKAAKLGDEEAKAVLSTIDESERAVREMIGLADDAPLEDIFKQSAIRFANPFAGLFPSYIEGKIPALGQSFELPLLTPGSAKAFELLDGPLYNARVKVGEVTKKTLDGMKAIGGPVGLTAEALEAVSALPKLVSKRLAAGGDNTRFIIDEHQKADAYLQAQLKREYDLRFAKFEQLAGENSDNLLTQMTRAIQSATRMDNVTDPSMVKKSLDATEEAFGEISEDLGGSIVRSTQGSPLAQHAIKKATKGTAVQDVGVLRQATEQIRNSFNAINPGLGDEAARLMELSAVEFDEFAAEAMEKGILRNTLENYFPSAFSKSERLSDEAAKSAMDEVLSSAMARGGRPGFSMEREYQSMAEGFLKGLRPKENFKERVIARAYAQRKAIHEQEFFERLGLQTALKPEAYAALKKAVDSGNQRIAQSAVEFLRKIDIDEQQALTGLADGVVGGVGSKPMQIKNIFEEAGEAVPRKFRFKLRMRNGNIVTPDDLNRLLQISKDRNQPTELIEQAAEELKYLGLAERDLPIVEKFNELYSAYRSRLLGREGETVFTRAGTELANEKFRKYIANTPGLDPDVARLYKGVLPKSLVNVVNEAYDNKTLWQNMAKTFEAKGNKRLADAITKTEKAFGSYLSAVKLGATQFWPAYHAQNAAGAQLQGVDAIASLGAALNPSRLIETEMLRRRNGKIVQKGTGAIFSADQLWKESRRLGFLSESPLDAADIIEQQAGWLRKIGGKIPGAAQASAFSKWVENFGRHHLYIQLRREGFDPVSAADRVSRSLVDYTHGKTKFERDVLNNLFFFYSFARTSTANQLKNLVSRPGALTTQLHASNAIREFLIDPNIYNIHPEEEEELKTLRGSETLSRLIGYDEETGNPIMLQGTGVPIETSARFFQVKVPTELTVRDLFNAAAESTQRTGQVMIAATNPAISGLMKWISGKDFYFDRPLTDKGLRKVAKFSQDWPKIAGLDPNLVPNAIWETLDSATRIALDGKDNGDGTFMVNPYRLALLGALVPGYDRFRTTMGALTKDGVSDAKKNLRLFTGMKSVVVDPDKSKAFDDRMRLLKHAELLGVPTTDRQLEERMFIDAMMGE